MLVTTVADLPNINSGMGSKNLKKAILADSPFSQRICFLQRLHVFRLPALGPLGHVELDGLALLKALETACLDCREMHKHIFATLTANKAIAFGVVEPLHCSLFHKCIRVFLF